MSVQRHKNHEIDSRIHMLAKVLSERARRIAFVVPSGIIDDAPSIERRVADTPTKAQAALRLVLSYLYKMEGPTNLRNPQYRLAEPHLSEHEKVLACYLKSRTNGKGRKNYGKAALLAMRRSRYRCEVCAEGDVRFLVLDHANGRGDLEAFFVLCANCHQLKSRLFDWTGKKRPARASPIAEEAAI